MTREGRVKLETVEVQLGFLFSLVIVEVSQSCCCSTEIPVHSLMLLWRFNLDSHFLSLVVEVVGVAVQLRFLLSLVDIVEVQLGFPFCLVVVEVQLGFPFPLLSDGIE